MPLAKDTKVYFVSKVASVDKRTGRQTIALPDMEGTIDWAGAGQNGVRYRVFVPAINGSVFCSPSQIHEHRNDEPEDAEDIGERINAARQSANGHTVDVHGGIQQSQPHVYTQTGTQIQATVQTLLDTWERRMSAKIYTLENMEDGEHYRRTLEWIIDGMIARRV